MSSYGSADNILTREEAAKKGLVHPRTKMHKSWRLSWNRLCKGFNDGDTGMPMSADKWKGTLLGMKKSFEDLGREVYGPNFYGDDETANLQKALATSAISGFGDATPLRLENLDAVMSSVLFQAGHLKIFNQLPRVPSTQIVYQWMQELLYGDERGIAGFVEGGTPPTTTSQWERNLSTVRYMGTRRGYTHQMLAVGQAGGSFVDPVARENRNGTLDLLQKIERWVLYGQAAITDGTGNLVNYDGFNVQMLNAGTNVLDKQGQPLDYEDFENIGEVLANDGVLLNFDNVRVFATPRTLSDLAKLKFNAEWYPKNPDAAVAGYRPGLPIEGYNSQHGYFPFEESIFIGAVKNNRVKMSNTGASVADSVAPTAPSAVTATVATTNGTALPAGTRYYWVTAMGPRGESLPTASGAVVIPAGGASVSLAIVNAASGTGDTAAIAFRVYCNEKGVNSVTDPGTTLLYTVPSGTTVGVNNTITAGGTSSGGVTIGLINTNATYIDNHQTVPGSYDAFIQNMSEEDIAIAQLAPLIKFPLAITSTTIEFLLMLYHLLVIKIPQRMYYVKNIGIRA